MSQGKKLLSSLKAWDLTRGQGVKQVVGGVQCNGPAFSETGGSANALQRWQREADDFLGQ